MPGEVTGRALYKWICWRRPELATRVVFTVSDAASEEVAALLADSGCLFIQKPFEVEKFLAVIRQAVAQMNSSALRR